MGPAFSEQMSGQMPGCPAATRVMSRKPPAASRSSAPFCSAPTVGGVHQGGGHQVGHMGDHGHQAVVIIGGEDEHVGAELGHHALQAVEGVEVRRAGRGQDPHRALEEVGSGARAARSARIRPSGARR